MRYSFVFDLRSLITLLNFLIFYLHNIQYLPFIVNLHLRMFFFVYFAEIFCGVWQFRFRQFEELFSQFTIKKKRFLKKNTTAVLVQLRWFFLNEIKFSLCFDSYLFQFSKKIFMTKMSLWQLWATTERPSLFDSNTSTGSRTFSHFWIDWTTSENLQLNWMQTEFAWC